MSFGVFLVLVLLALAFGIGAVIKGLLWLVLVAVLLAIAAGYAGFRWVRNRV